jgi:hypothetical protein
MSRDCTAPGDGDRRYINGTPSGCGRPTAAKISNLPRRFAQRAPNPELYTAPLSDAYRFFEPSLLNLIFGFSQRCDMAQRMAEFYGEFVDSDSYSASAEENSIVMGSEALDIARTTRQKYRLGERRLEFDSWNIEAFFKKELAIVQEKKAERERAIKKREKPEGA